MRIGILGSSGTVGRHIAAYLLQKGYSVCGAQRRRTAEFDNYRNFSQLVVDISDPNQLESFCQSCDFLINCIAPSFIHGFTIAEAAGRCGCVYIDLTDAVMERELPEEGVYVTSCGYIPGLSAYLPKILNERFFDTVDSVTEFQGGNEICSANALIDIILSSEISGRGDSFYRSGSLEQISFNISKKYQLPFFSGEVFLKPYISKELVYMAQRENIGSFRWFNVYENIQQFAFILKMVGVLAKSSADQTAAIINSECEKRRSLLNEEIHAVLGAELIGIKNNVEKCIRFKLDVHDSSVLCGVTAAVVAERVIERGASPGKHYGYEFIPESFIDEIGNYLTEGESFEVTEISPEEAFTKILE